HSSFSCEWKPTNPDTTSLFDHMYQLEGIPTIRVITDMDLYYKNSLKEEYQPAEVLITDPAGEEIINTMARIRTRGNVRKKVCGVPPAKIDFSKEDLTEAGFLKLDDLKFVFPCGRSKLDQERLYREYLIYTIYELISEHAIHAALVRIELEGATKVEYDFTGFVVEDEEEYERRKNATIIEEGKITYGGIERESFLKMTFFQYMIANTDWGVSTKHNLEIVKLNDEQLVLALPYDYDFSGFVGHNYAEPNDQLPIKSVHQRYYFPYEISLDEFDSMVVYYKSMQPAIIEKINNATYLKEKTRKACADYLMEFFELLDKPKRLKKSIIRKVR
ncbi:MAG: hypothetical protein KJP00_07825, partial [Bacteroidia bacterium]|nr:hypothetical protein [Bacteroidia bacterium]